MGSLCHEHCLHNAMMGSRALSPIKNLQEAVPPFALGAKPCGPQVLSCRWSRLLIEFAFMLLKLSKKEHLSHWAPSPATRGRGAANSQAFSSSSLSSEHEFTMRPLGQPHGAMPGEPARPLVQAGLPADLHWSPCFGPPVQPRFRLRGNDKHVTCT
jgi:hypothetical protein